MRNRLVVMRERWQRQLDDLRFKLNWTEAYLRDAEGEGRLEQAERARQKVEALTAEMRDHRAKRSF